jgi:hypothetical protein
MPIGDLMACGGIMGPVRSGPLVMVIIYLFAKPIAYLGFILAFRYRVSRAIPMRYAQASKLAVTRTLLDFLVDGVALLILFGPAQRISNIAVPSWILLQAARALVWWYLGTRGARLVGRRLVGWVISGTALNFAFDIAAALGLFAGWPAFLIVGVIVVFITVLERVGQRRSLKARFDSGAVCTVCDYDLTGNLSGICPECGTPIAAQLRM